MNAHPVLEFREQLRVGGLIRRYQGSLRLTSLGRALHDDPVALWEHLADTVLCDSSAFAAECSVVVAVHLATGDGRVDRDAVARMMTGLGWVREGGQSLPAQDVYPSENRLWEVLGNVGERVSGPPGVRLLSGDARRLVADALLAEERVTSAEEGVPSAEG